MRTSLVHLSDLHFDRTDPAVVEALAASADEAKPDCLVLSGDLTQRGFGRQYRIGLDFLARFDCHKLCIAGNHDVPMHRPLSRLVAPLGRFYKYVTPHRQPVWDDGHVCIVGINTARAVAPRLEGFWKDGAISSGQVRSAIDTFKKSLAPFRVVVTHHPMLVAHPEQRNELVRGHTRALATFADFGVELFMYGHLHLPHILPATVRHGESAPKQVVGLLAGTGCSTRLRGGVANSYNRVRFDETGFDCDTLHYDGRAFAITATNRFESPRRRTNPAHR